MAIYNITSEQLRGGGILNSFEISAGGSFSNTRSLLFDGNDDVVNCGDNNNLSFGDGSSDSTFSMSAWVKVTEGDGMYIMSKNRHTSPLSNDEYAFYISSSSKKLIFFLIDNDLLNRRGRMTNAIASSVFADWMHVAVTYNGVGGNTAQNGLKLYINGVRSDTADSTKNTYTAMHNFTTPLRIGAYHESLFGEGSIDEAAIFNTELSATDIANIYNSGVPADLSGFSSLVSWWRFEEGSGTTATDSGTGGNDGTITGATYQTDVPS